MAHHLQGRTATTLLGGAAQLETCTRNEGAAHRTTPRLRNVQMPRHRLTSLRALAGFATVLSTLTVACTTSTAPDDDPVASEAQPSTAVASSCATCSAPADVQAGATRTTPKPAADKRCKLPAGCKVLEGSLARAEWLQCYRNNQGTILTSGAWLAACVFSPFTGCPLSQAEKNTIVAACRTKPSIVDKMACVANEVDLELSFDSGNVCRHYSSCVDSIGGALGIGTTFHTGTAKGGHAWTESYDPGPPPMAIIVDAFNGIVMTCPSPPPVDFGNPN